MKHIRDPLHGYIELRKEEVKILDSPQMQRLRRIKQNGLTDLVYPGANHTRFDHSLGVMHLAGKFAENLDLDQQRKQELRIAGLLHDSGHGPFSHASEVVAEQKDLSHEEMSCRKVRKLEDTIPVDTDRIEKIIHGELEIGQAVAGEIDADRMDYLERDAYFTGVDHGNIDAETIIRVAEIDSRRLVFNHKAVEALEGLLTARFHMMKSVYTHHASQIAEKMLQRSLESYIQQGNNAEQMMKLDDYQAHNQLLEAEGPAKKLYSRIKDRRLYKRALVWDIDDISQKQMKKLEETEAEILEKEIAEEAGLQHEKVIVDKPWTPEIQELDIKVKKNGSVRNMKHYSPIPEALTEAEWRLVDMAVYTPGKKKDKVRDAADTVLRTRI
ncbi:MAG: HD domain-containing protein [Candidatus Nanohalobium sp.]